MIPSILSGARVTVMGLGLHGGGMASARYLASHGARVTVTDLKSREQLSESIGALEGLPIRFVLGRHEQEDFSKTDLLVKNPGVPADSPFLEIARDRGIPIETDISLFLSSTCNQLAAVTGSKGKSTVTAAIHHGLKREYAGARLGGNITVSPLSFVDELSPDDPVVLELSSWQLADLRGKRLLKPFVSVITNIMPDHMNRYSSMQAYIDDKRVILSEQDQNDFAILGIDTTRLFAVGAAPRILEVSDAPLPDDTDGAFLDGDEGHVIREGRSELIVPREIRLVGRHNRVNLLTAGLALHLFGVSAESIRKSLSDFAGLEHRMERICDVPELEVYNDSAATIPHAAVEAMGSLEPPLRVIMGGTDKNIDFSPLEKSIGKPEMVVLLRGSATTKMITLFQKWGRSFSGPYDSIEEAVSEAFAGATPGSRILFSPACTSFEMFDNEFDRGRKFKAAVRDWLDNHGPRPS